MRIVTSLALLAASAVFVPAFGSLAWADCDQSRSCKCDEGESCKCGKMKKGKKEKSCNCSHGEKKAKGSEATAS